MIFSKYVKNEILEKNYSDAKLGLAFLSGLIGSTGKLDEKECLKLGSDNEKLGQVINKITKNLFNEDIEIIKSENYGINKIHKVTKV